MKYIKKFEGFGDDIKRAFKGDSKDRYIKTILSMQGTDVDQRKVKGIKTKIYTKDELESMTLDEVISIYHKVDHPAGRPW
jgi:hypothetical protein